MLMIIISYLFIIINNNNAIISLAINDNDVIIDENLGDLVELNPPELDNENNNNRISDDMLINQNDDDDNDNNSNYWEKGNNFEGDIISNFEEISGLFGSDAAKDAEKTGKIEKRLRGGKGRSLGVNNDFSKLWKTRNSNLQVVVPYEISASFSVDDTKYIENALINFMSKVKYIKLQPRAGEVDAIRFEPGKGCNSPVGRQGKVQIINLESPGCISVGTIQHEVTHSLGFWHEQSRYDRDSYVSVYWDNIIAGFEGNFNKQNTVVGGLGSLYDYSSIMHYSTGAFGKRAVTCSQTAQVCDYGYAIVFKGYGQDGSKQFCLDVKNGQYSVYDGQTVQLYTCGALSYTNQLWSVEPYGTSSVIIRLAKNRNYCLTVAYTGGRDKNNMKMKLYKCRSTDIVPYKYQTFQFHSDGDWSKVKIYWHGDNNYCLDRYAPNTGSTTKDGNSMQIYTCGAANFNNQIFSFKFFNYKTNVCVKVNYACSLTSNYLSTINAKGNSVGLNSLAKSDISQLEALYECSSGPRHGEYCPLRNYNSACNAVSKSRTPECVNAMHKFCSTKKILYGAISQEYGTSIITVACFGASWYGNVLLSSLKTHHSGCSSLTFGQTPNCVAAAHRWCVKEGKGNAGLIQGSIDPGFGVACFTPSWYGSVPLVSLKAYHAGCNSVSLSQAPDCVAAIRRWCSGNAKGTNGIAQEVGADNFGVACFNANWYGVLSVN